MFARQSMLASEAKVDLEVWREKVRRYGHEEDKPQYRESLATFLKVDERFWQTRRETMEAVGDAKVMFSERVKLQELIATIEGTPPPALNLHMPQNDQDAAQFLKKINETVQAQAAAIMAPSGQILRDMLAATRSEWRPPAE
jgi:hypothetical protein